MINLLSAADARNGLPPGTMASVMQQEIGGNDRFIKDPSAYHYEADAKGRRVAPHTGKISTAFGPFGILESTAKDPGYGVAPLKDKSLEEQVRFASDYAAARAKSAGSLAGGLAGYGEGAKYAAQVVNRIPGQKVVAPAPVVAATELQANRNGAERLSIQEQAPYPAPVVAAATAPLVPQAPVQAGPDPWQEFLAASRSPTSPAQLQYGTRRAPALEIPDFGAAVAGVGQAVSPNLSMLAALRGFA